MFLFKFARPLFDIEDDSGFGGFDDILNDPNPTDDTVDEVDDTNTQDDNELSGEEELLKALRELNGSDEDDSDEDNRDDNEEDTNPEDDNTNEQDDVVDNDDTGKKKQSPEENAKFAAERRQKELEAKVQAEVERLRQESPEFQLAKQLTDLYGVPADQLAQQIKDAQMQKESTEKGIPLEVLKQQEADRQRTSKLEQELNQLKYDAWKSRIDSESLKLQDQYKMLTKEDMDAAVSYMLNTVHNVDMPLEQAVYAIHGQRIVEELAKTKVQDQLAEQSGRKRKTPLAPKGGAGKEAVTLSPEEAQIAKLYGMTAEEYRKYQS